MSITKTAFGTLAGQAVELFTLSNSQGVEANITNYGGIIVSLKTPDQQGNLGDIVLGFDSFETYLNESPYFGCITGRFANRLAGGRFSLEGIAYQLERNDGENHLHGGLKGLDKRLWQAETFERADGVALRLSYTSPDGEEAYPGRLTISVTYTLTNSDELRIDYKARTDKTTIINLTNHSYFNLAGTGDILNHEVVLHANSFVPVDETLIPIGDVRGVEGTPFDFRQAARIGARINEQDVQLLLAGGYDHNWVLQPEDDALMLAASVYEASSGRGLELYTTQPGVQFYTGNMLTTLSGKAGQIYKKHSGFCLETQHFPDSPNQASFPSTILRPEEHYEQTTVFKFL